VKNASLGVFRAPADFLEPDSVDWPTDGAVTAVKNQARCGSCWSFSTTGALEGAWKIAGHDLISLSEQNILDCDNGIFSGHKCKGGSMDQAFGWVAKKRIMLGGRRCLCLPGPGFSPMQRLHLQIQLWELRQGPEAGRYQWPS